MDEVIETGIVELKLRDNMNAELDRAVAEAEAKLKELGRQKATIEIKAKVDDLAAKVAEAKAALKSLEDQEKKEQAQLSQTWGEERLLMKDRIAGIQEAQKATKAALQDSQNELTATRKLQAAQNQEFSQQRFAAKADQVERQLRAKDDALRLRATQQQMRLDKQASDARKVADLGELKDAQRSIDLQRQYYAEKDKLSTINKLPATSSQTEKIKVELDKAGAVLKMEELKAELAAMGRNDIVQKISVETDKSSSNKLMSFLGWGKDQTSLFDQASASATGLKDKLTKLGNTKVNFGPITAGIGPLIAGISILSPLIVGLAGGLLSLVSVTGAALGGALVTGGAAMTGMAMASFGLRAEIKPLMTQFTNAHNALNAYNLAVQTYGVNSRQATTAQLQLNAAMKNMSPGAKQALQDWNALDKTWKSLTASSASNNFGNIVAATFKTANQSVTWFAKDTNLAFTEIAHGWDHAMHQLQSPGGQAGLQSIFGNFDTALPKIIAGIDHLATAIGRMFVTASSFLPGLAKGFDNWANGIDKASAKSGGFASGIKTMITSMQEFGHFAQAALKWLLAFFGAGVGPGGKLLNDFTAALNRSTKAMNTGTGHSNLINFFKQSVVLTEQLVSAFAPLISAVLKFAVALGPLGSVAMHVVEIFTKLISAIVTLGTSNFKPIADVLGLAVGVALIGRLTRGFVDLGKAAAGIGTSLKDAFVAFRGGAGIKDALKGAFGSAGAGSEIAAAMETAGTAAAAEIGTAMEAAGAAAAAEIGAAMASGGLAGAAEKGVVGAVTGAAATDAGAAAAGVAGGAEAAAIADTGAAAAATTAEVAGLTTATVAADAATGGLVATLGGVLGAEGLVPGLGWVAAGLTAAVGAFLLFNAASSDSVNIQALVARSIKGTATATTESAKTAKSLFTGWQSVSNAASDLKSTTDQVNSAQSEYNKLAAAGQLNTAKGRAVTDQLNSALRQQQTQAEGVAASVKSLTAEHAAYAKMIDGTVVGAENVQEQATQRLAQRQKEYQAALNTHNEIAILDARTKLSQATRDYSNATSNVTTALNLQARAEEKLTVDSLNKQRALKGETVVPAGGPGLTNTASLINEVTGTKAMKLIIDTPNVNQIEKIAQLVQGLPKSKVIQILSNSADAAVAIAKLNALQLTAKKLQISADNGAALAALAHVEGVKLSAKTQKLLVQGDAAVIAKVQHIQGMQLSSKLLRLLGDNSSATKAYQSIANLPAIQKVLKMLGLDAGAGALYSQLNGLANIVKTVTFVAKQIGNFSVKGFAAGGVVGAASGYSPGGPALDRVQDGAFGEALSRRPQHATGGMFSKPTLLHGDDNGANFVVSTNPAYRTRNKNIVATAAGMMGMGVEGFAKGGAPPYEKKLQKRFEGVSDTMEKMWKIARPWYHQTGAMPKATYTQGNDALFVGVDFSQGTHPGRRDFFLPDWIAGGQPGEKGLNKMNPVLLELILHEWSHEFQRADIVGKVKMPKGLDPFEGGAEANAELIAPSVFSAMGIHAKPDQGSYIPDRKWVEKYLGWQWIHNTQFGFAQGADVAQANRGGMYGSPTFLVGEENRPEFVISTNPAYKEQNQTYLQQAAGSLGMHVVKAAIGYSPVNMHNPALIPLPARDRIAGVPTTDISTLITTEQTELGKMQTADTTAAAFNKSNAAAIKKGKVQPKKIPYTTAQLNAQKAQINGLNRFLREATADAQAFTDLETSITNYEGALAIADGNPYGIAPDPTTGKMSTYGQLQGRLVGLENKHMKELLKAVGEARRDISGNRRAANLQYLQTLEGAYGASILQFEQDATSSWTYTPPTGAAGAGGAGSAASGSMALADFITLEGGTPALNAVNEYIALTQAAIASDPAGSQQLTSDTAALATLQTDLANFDTAVLKAALGWTNPNLTPRAPGNDALLITAAAGAYTTDQGAVNNAAAASTSTTSTTPAAPATGPTNDQLAATALSTLYNTYGNNVTAPIIGGAQGANVSPGGAQIALALQGGAAAGPAMVASAHALPSPAAATSPAGATVNVTNHFSHPPADPHSWSQSTAWELQAAM